MEERRILITYDEAREWFNDGYMWDEASKKVVKDPNAFRWEE